MHVARSLVMGVPGRRAHLPVGAEGSAECEMSNKPNMPGGSESLETSEEPTAVAFTAGSSGEIDAAYLATFMQAGGAAAQAYKQLSYELLRVRPGMSVVDIGCGSGIDLQNLRTLAGAGGRVIGVERNATLVTQARQRLAEAGATDGAITVMCADAEHVPIHTASIDRVRADRALQHAENPARVLTEMWRILRPEGILAVVEPDWGMIGIDPGGTGGGDDEHALSLVLGWMKQHLAHATIGRQLHGLLRGMGDTAWTQVRVQTMVFQLDWETVDPILEVAGTVEALIQEDPALRDELEAWLRRIEEASGRGTFWAGVPLMFATAQKVPGQHA